MNLHSGLTPIDKMRRDRITAGQGAERAFGRAMQMIDDNRAVVLTSPSPEGPHQMRVGLRRLRAALKVFRPLLPASQVADLNDRARALGREVGELRDLDVVCHELVGPLAAADPKDQGLARLYDALEARVETARAELRTALRSRRVCQFIADGYGVLETVAASTPARPLAPLVHRALTKRFQKARSFGNRFDKLGELDRHEFRKELKKLRYSIDSAAPALEPEHHARLIRSLKKLQNSLGNMNDALVARAVLDATAKASKSKKLRAAAERVATAQEQRGALDRARVVALWADFSKDMAKL